MPSGLAREPNALREALREGIGSLRTGPRGGQTERMLAGSRSTLTDWDPVEWYGAYQSLQELDRDHRTLKGPLGAASLLPSRRPPDPGARDAHDPGREHLSGAGSKDGHDPGRAA